MSDPNIISLRYDGRMHEISVSSLNLHNNLTQEVEKILGFEPESLAGFIVDYEGELIMIHPQTKLGEG